MAGPGLDQNRQIMPSVLNPIGCRPGVLIDPRLRSDKRMHAVPIVADEYSLPARRDFQVPSRFATDGPEIHPSELRIFPDGSRPVVIAVRVPFITDFEHGFIRAEVVSYDDFIAHSGEHGAKDAGKWRLEGREYIVREGDVILFRFNV